MYYIHRKLARDALSNIKTAKHLDELLSLSIKTQFPTGFISRNSELLALKENVSDGTYFCERDWRLSSGRRNNFPIKIAAKTL